MSKKTNKNKNRKNGKPDNRKTGETGKNARETGQPSQQAINIRSNTAHD